jgi:hypothetical protein
MPSFVGTRLRDFGDVHRFALYEIATRDSGDAPLSTSARYLAWTLVTLGRDLGDATR